MTDMYFLRYDDAGPWVEVSAMAFINAEHEAGFHPKPGCGPFATAGFSASIHRGGRLIEIQGRTVNEGTDPDNYDDWDPIFAEAIREAQARRSDDVSDR